MFPYNEWVRSDESKARICSAADAAAAEVFRHRYFVSMQTENSLQNTAPIQESCLFAGLSVNLPTCLNIFQFSFLSLLEVL